MVISAQGQLELIGQGFKIHLQPTSNKAQSCHEIEATIYKTGLPSRTSIVSSVFFYFSHLGALQFKYTTET